MMTPPSKKVPTTLASSQLPCLLDQNSTPSPSLKLSSHGPLGASAATAAAPAAAGRLGRSSGIGAGSGEAALMEDAVGSRVKSQLSSTRKSTPGAHSRVAWRTCARSIRSFGVSNRRGTAIKQGAAPTLRLLSTLPSCICSLPSWAMPVTEAAVLQVPPAPLEKASMSSDDSASSGWPNRRDRDSFLADPLPMLVSKWCRARLRTRPLASRAPGHTSARNLLVSVECEVLITSVACGSQANLRASQKISKEWLGSPQKKPAVTRTKRDRIGTVTTSPSDGRVRKKS
mmetsp:Transcript_63211/g.181289  ORF Transcript_63211/g.181289 Transcript_63211/m.181289 type:complete len:286 (+) Transcript_63211:380-1237(+)